MTLNLETLRQQLARKASTMIVGNFWPSADPFASWLGHVQVALPHEAWPRHRNRPMTPLCQINCAELPHRPDALADIALLSVFVDLDDFPAGKFDDDGDLLETVKKNGDSWLLRAYSSLDGLVRIQEPAGCRTISRYRHARRVGKPYGLRRDSIKPFPVRWELAEEDYPARESFYDYLDFPYPSGNDFLDLWLAKFPLELLDEYPEVFATCESSKVGGWPHLIEGRIFQDHPTGPQYVFQIAAERRAGLYWGDVGTAYFGRGTSDAADQWFAECRSH